MAAPHRTNTAKASSSASTGAFGLSELLANRKTPSVLLADVRAHVLDKARRPDPGRNLQALHPSDICRSDWCPRAALARLRGGVSSGPTTFARENVFAYGKQAHTRWQRWLAEMGLLEGNWYCNNYARSFYADNPEHCRVCGFDDHVYDELALADDSLMLEGRTDGYVPSRRCLVEIKTVGEGTIRYADPALIERHRIETPRGTVTDLKGLWDAIHKPFVSHLRQGQLYLYLARARGLDVERIVFLYESKLTQDDKEFTVSYDRSLIDGILTGARAVKLAYDGDGDDPPCRAPGRCADCASLS